MSLQMPVPPSTTDWCISAFTASLSSILPLEMISESMCDRRSRVSGSMVWYSSSIPIVRLGLILPSSYKGESPESTLTGRGARLGGIAHQEMAPTVLHLRRLLTAGLADRELSYVLYHPIEIRLPDRMHIGVGSRVQEVDSVGNTVLDGEFNRIEVV